MKTLPSITTPRTVLEILEPRDASLMLKYYVENATHLDRWEPSRTDEFLTLDHWRSQLRANIEFLHTRTAFKFSALDLNRSEVMAVCNFTNACYGPLQACHLGYSIAAKYEGQGLMQEILEAAIKFVFSEVGLHRVMANYIPSNYRSAALLARLGFEREGYARSYMQIAGRWQDHVLTSKINDDWKDRAREAPSAVWPYRTNASQ